MRLHRYVFLLSPFGAAATFLGATYPAPRDLTSNSSLVQAAWRNASAVFDAYLKQGKNTTATTGITGTENITFSAGLFSIHDNSATRLQYHYTAPQVAQSQIGSNEVDAESLYRVASVTKLMTVFTGMIGIKEEDWNAPVTKFIPELANVTSANAPDWKRITLWALASHLAGVQANGVVADTILFPFGGNVTEAVQLGLPPRGIDALGPCPGNTNCTTADFITSYGPAPAIFPPYTNPAYSNFGLMVLGRAISRITKKPYDRLYQDLLFKPLGMNSSYANAPTSGPVFADHAVIPGPVGNSYSFPHNSFALPSGGILSTITDLSKLGTAILNYTLLSAERTHKWMKPHSHTASLTYSVGAPWEIVRYTNKATGKVTDIYGKLGDSGAYGGIVGLIPDYGAGFTLLNAYYEDLLSPQTRGARAMKLINHITEFVMPALEAQAQAEANAAFAGTYSSPEEELNSTLTIVPSPHGLTIDRWVSNGTDMTQRWYTGTTKPRLLPTFHEAHPDRSAQITFQVSTSAQYLTYEAAGLGPYTGFYDSNYDFVLFDQLRYGGKSLLTWRFEVDAEGKAVKVWNDAVGLKMAKET